MRDNEWLFESYDENGDKMYQEGMYDDEHMHIQNPEDFIDLMRDNFNEEEIFDENTDVF